ncbi:hypothetical protein ACOMHN_010624 [Nucella lapillus]
MRIELQKNENDIEGHIQTKDLQSVRKSMYHERRKILPKLPKSRQETHVCVGAYDLKSSHNEDMIKVNDSDTGIVIFSTRSNLELFCSRGAQIFGDGTFKTCPRFFYQLYILHVYKHGQYVPCTFALLPSKTEEVYSQMFVHIQTLCDNEGLGELRVNSIHLDFEKATHGAVKAIWPAISTRGCHFHLSQAWYRKLNNLGLSNDYKDNESEISGWLKRFFGLSFLQPEAVGESFAFELLDDCPGDPRCQTFADYILNNYVSEEAAFQPEIWAEPDVNSIRTTNACESFHRHFGDQFYHTHPNVFEFMQKLKEVQTYSYVKMNTITAGGALAPVRRERREKLQQLATIKTRFTDSEISRKEFLKQMACKNLPAML